MFLNCAEEVFRYIGGTFKSALIDPTVGPKFAQSPVRIRIGLVDPDCVLVIDMQRGEVSLGGVSDELPAAMIAMNGDTANRYCQGRVDVGSAMANGDIAAAGEIQAFFDLVGDGADLSRLYAEVLRREGREDLLVA
jgi:hypothetical protein